MRLAALLVVATLITACGSEPALIPTFDPSVSENELSDVIESMRRGDPAAALELLDAMPADTLPEGADHYRALALMDAGRNDEARDVWEREVARHPGNGRAHAFLAEILMDEGDLAGAEEHLAAAQRFVPEFAGQALLSGQLALLKDDDVAAERLFVDYLESDPYGSEAALAHESLKQIFARRGPEHADRATYHADIAEYLREVHRYRAGYRQRLLENPEDAEAAYGIATTYLNLYYRTADGDTRLLDEGDRALQRVLEIDPEYARAIANLGSLRAQGGKYAEARALFARAVELEPDLFRAQLQLGLIDARAGSFETARAHFESAIACADGDLERTEALAKAGDELAEAFPAEALEYLRAYLALAPLDPAGLAPLAARLEQQLGG